MSISKYTSEVKTINNDQETVYNFLSNFENLSKIINEQSLEMAAEKVPQLNIKDFKADPDSCSFVVDGFGETGLRIIEREAPKVIKMTGNGTVPFEFFIWIQLLPAEAYQTKLKLTLHAGLNMMMKMVVGSKLEEGINKIADALTQIPYQ